MVTRDHNYLCSSKEHFIYWVRDGKEKYLVEKHEGDPSFGRLWALIPLLVMEEMTEGTFTSYHVKIVKWRTESGVVSKASDLIGIGEVSRW